MVSTRRTRERTASTSGAALLAGAGSGAVRTAPVQDDVVPAHGVAEALADAVDEPFELRIRENVALPAALADGVMVMLAAGMRGLEAGGAVDVEAMDEAERRQHLERAVDAREARRPAVGGTEAIMDLLSAQAAVLALEQREDLLTRAAGAMAGPRKLPA